ncbi:MAG: GNAT family N-acetyltransferase [Saprospiraceae bacterium]|nr:GNAT family N-acetyltransferase [Saprospiraceae bacterium]
MEPSQIPTLKTGRLFLRPLSKTDIEFIYKIRTDPNVNQFLDRSIPSQPQEAAKFINSIIEGNLYYWCIMYRQKAVGTICLWNMQEDEVEVGYELLPEFQHRGIMHEALQRLINFCSDTLQLKNVKASTHRNNQPSINLLLRNRFTFKEDDDDDFQCFELNLLEQGTGL